jgi:hypothetical protein
MKKRSKNRLSFLFPLKYIYSEIKREGEKEEVEFIGK